MANKRIIDLTNQGTIANADLLEVQVSTESVTKKATVEVVTKVERDARIAQDNVIEAGAGLNADGTYATPVGSNWIDSTTSIQDAVETLDGVIGSSVVTVDEVSLSSASLNNAGIAPYEIIAAPGANKYIEVISASCSLDFDSAAVDCGTQKLVLEFDTGASHFMEWSNAFIESGANIINKGTWTSEVGIITNKKVQLTFENGANPTAGDSRIKIAITYIILDI